MQDILDRLDAELTAAPDPTFDLPCTLAAGRRAVRRRRVATAGAAAAAVLVVAGASWALAPGDGDSRGRDSRQAAEPTPSAAPRTTTPAAPEPWGDDELLRLPPDGGSADVNPAAVVVAVEPYIATNGTNAEVFHLRLRGRGYYALWADTGISSVPLPAQGMTLREWAESQLTADDHAAADWVTIDARSRLTAKAGVRIVQQRPDPGFGDSFAGPGEPTAVARVEVDGWTYFLAARALGDGTTEVIPYRRNATITSIDAFVDFTRERYSTNEQGGSEGLR